MTTTTTPSTEGARTTPERPLSRWWAPLGGLLVVATAFAVTELVAALGIWAGLFSAASAPILSLANSFIVLTPEWLKEFAIRQFGTNDKVALGVGMYLTIAVVAALLGVLAARRPRPALGALVVLAVVVAVAVLTRANTTVTDLVPLVIGVAVAIAVFRRLFPRPWARSAASDASPAAPGRRSFFVTAGVTAAVAAVAGGVSRVVPTGATALAKRDKLTLPKPAQPYAVPAGAELDVPGITPLVTPSQDFYRIDTSFQPPVIDIDSWTLSVKGMVDNPIELSWSDVTGRPMVEVPVTLTCVSNEVGGELVGNAVWLGTHIRDVLAEARIQQGADCVLCTDVNGFTLSAPLEALTDDRDALLAVGMNGTPLPIEHGYPVRMVVPGLYGFVSATKWIASMEVTTFSKVSAYWTQRGWSDHGPIKMSSRIDTPAAFGQVPAGAVTLGGMAWAQHTGIKEVQVQIDDGPWTAAEISRPLSVDTWVQWKYVWQNAGSGLHTAKVRAVDANGELQVEARAEPIPNGSSGWQSRQFTVT